MPQRSNDPTRLHSTRYVNLFGETVDPSKMPRHSPQRGGYAAMPGTGPEGETCKTCRHKYRREGGARYFNKCALVKPTSGAGTDIRVSSPACSRWEKGG